MDEPSPKITPPANGNGEENSRVESAIRTHSSPVLHWWHIALGLALAALTVVLAPREKSLEFANLTEGTISPSRVIAPIDFEILKFPEELELERAAAAATVLPVVVALDSQAEGYIDELHSFVLESHRLLGTLSPIHFSALSNRLEHLSAEDSLEMRDLTGALSRRFGFQLGTETWNFLLRLDQLDKRGDPGVYPRFFDSVLSGILRNVYEDGVVNVPRDSLAHPSDSVILIRDGEETIAPITQLRTASEANAHISQLLTELTPAHNLPVGSVNAGYEILRSFIVPNVIFNAEETKSRRDAAIARVPLAKGLVKKDELIIDRHIRVTREHLAKLNSLAVKRVDMRAEEGSVRALLPPAGHLLLAGLIITLLWLFIAVAAPNVWHDWKLMLVAAAVPALLQLFQSLVQLHYEWSSYVYPAAVGAMLLAILVGRVVAAGGVAALALFAGLLGGNDFGVAFGVLAVGATALLAVKRVQGRGDIMRAALYLIAVYIPLVAAFHFINYGSGNALGSDLLLAGVNALLSPVLVIGLVYLFENALGITTELSLLELVDLNRPLLRELALKSPGTYHHSIIVGTLAEAAARAIGANALLTRAGAYYHDIGKMAHKEYFIENQELGSANIHDRLAPEKSAQMVIEHVRVGLELADQHRLPPQVKAFISEHHGRTRLAYFYDKAQREAGGEVPDNGFRYPGPSPQSKETGILMFADLVEAATRSEGEHDLISLRETVDRLIRKRLADGDLDQAPLTLRELSVIKETFVQVLSGIYHQRIAYPGQRRVNETPLGTPNLRRAG
jgi:hypothetical protein